MDDPRPLARRLRAFRIVTLRASLFLIVLSSDGCTRPEPQVIRSVAPDGFVELSKSVAALRRLPFKRDITFESSSVNATGFDASKPFADYHGALPALEVERAYKSVGLLPNDADLRKALPEYRRLEELIDYDAAKGRVSLSRDAARLGAPFEKTNPRAAREAPAVFGIIKALQEQHFKWSVTLSSIFLEDRRLAFRAIAAGDAFLAVNARADGKGSVKLAAADIETAHGIAAELDKLAATLPDFLRRKLAFPYREGVSFVYWAFTAKGWDGVNALYANPPFTTAQILHPEKYFLRRLDSLRFFPAGLIRRVGESPMIEQSFGEYLVRLLLESEHSPKYAADTAAAWRGDQLFHFQLSGSPVTAWLSAWENEKDAGEFYRAYQSVVEKRQRVRFRPATDKSDAVIADTRDRSAFLLQVKGPVVLLLDAMPASRLLALAEEVWKDLEIEPESTVIPFESARGPAQWSPRSR